MGQPAVVGTAVLTCSWGVAPASLIPTPGTVMVGGKPAATIMDHTPANIPTFGMCTTLSNPVVAAATAAALGVLTPMPCVPAIAAPWIPAAPQTQISKKLALTSGSQCMCNWAGVITVTFPGQVQATMA
jgi:hypothetical protein